MHATLGGVRATTMANSHSSLPTHHVLKKKDAFYHVAADSIAVSVWHRKNMKV